MRLYEINMALEELVDKDTGEIIDEEKFEELQLAKNEKIEGLALLVKNNYAEAAAIRAEEKALAVRRKAVESKIVRLEKYLSDILAGKKFKTPKVAISFAKSESVVVSDDFVEWALKHFPSLLRYQDVAPDKNKIKNALRTVGVFNVLHKKASIGQNKNIQIK